jgi:hypothetical protein
MGWVCRNSFVSVGRILGGFANLMLVRALRFAFGKTFGAVIGLLRRSTPAYSVLLGSRKRL